MSKTGPISANAPPASSHLPLAHAGITLHILLVIDGERINFTKEAGLFGLGFVVDTLRASWSPAVRVDLALATREENIDEIDRGGFEVHTGFRFHPSKLRIDDWDQIWIFADQPSKSDDAEAADSLITSDNELDDDEVKLLAEWMDRGGGLFAVGDHNNLGAAVCYRIPRVRTMRRWRMADGVPTKEGEHQNSTLQPREPGYSDPENDPALQPLDLVYTQSVHSLPFARVDRPHPILCSPAGPINRFPDHMHEGELVPDAEVQMDRPLDIPGYSRPEYPPAVPEALARMVGMDSLVNWRPRPSIIAYGRTTNPSYFDPPEEREGVLARRPDTGYRRFGVVGVYDGDAANVGRIVCDSTWHHWFSWNVEAMAVADNAAYRTMQTYYRNVVLWLAKLDTRQRLLNATVWNTLTLSSPMEFTARQTVWEMGQRVTELTTSRIGPCWVSELVASQFNATALYRARKPEDLPQRPEWNRLPEDLVNSSVLGSIAKSMYPMVSRLRQERTRRSGVTADTESIDRLAQAGISRVSAMLRETLTTAIASLTALRDTLDVNSDEPGRP